MNEIHAKYRDRGLIVIGQNVWETSESAVEPFVKKMGDQMTYRVVLDDKSDGGKGKMSDTWLVPSGQGGIPAALLVDKRGRIAWVGHPMSLKEAYLEEVSNREIMMRLYISEGTFNRTRRSAIRSQARALDEMENAAG